MQADIERRKERRGGEMRNIHSKTSETVEIPAGESKVQFWRNAIKRWQASGLTKTAFCRQECLRINTFNIWNLRLSRDSDKKLACASEPELEFKIETFGLRPSFEAPVQSSRPVLAVLSDVEGKNRLTIYEGARPETIDAILSTFLR